MRKEVHEAAKVKNANPSQVNKTKFKEAQSKLTATYEKE